MKVLLIADTVECMYPLVVPGMVGQIQALLFSLRVCAGTGV